MLTASSRVWERGIERPLKELAIGQPLAAPAAATEREIEIGFGKGRFLLHRAAENPSVRFIGIEVSTEYFRIACDRAERKGLENLTLIRGEALLLLAAHFPAGFAQAIHIYFPDPWPKKRHRRRRLLDSSSIDLVFRALQPSGKLFFATDFLEYGNKVALTLSRYTGVESRLLSECWPDGARTNYETKYIAEGRPILRLIATRRRSTAIELHPDGRSANLAAYSKDSSNASPDESEDPESP